MSKYDGHVKFVKDFAFRFARQLQVKACLENAANSDGVNQAMMYYMNLLRRDLINDPMFRDE